MIVDLAMKGDYLNFNRLDRVRVIQNGETLLIQHRLKGSKPLAAYDEKALTRFVNAHSPVKLAEYIEQHGYLFCADDIADVELENDSHTPNEHLMRETFSVFNWSAQKPRATTQAIRNLHQQAIDLDREGECFSHGLRLPYEHLGDWVAARAVILAAIEMIELAPAIRNQKICPPFSIRFADAPEYTKYLLDRNPSINHESIGIVSEDGSVIEHPINFTLADGYFKYTPAVTSKGATVSEVLDKLVNLHLNSIHVECIDLELHCRLQNLLQVLWYQMQEQAGRKFIVRRCDNCHSLMTSTPNGNNKRACCDSCEQALKPSAIKKGR